MRGYWLSRLAYAVLLLCMACSDGPSTESSVTRDSESSLSPPEPSYPIVAGERLGTLRILDRMDTVSQKLGPAVFSDSGAGTTVSRYELKDGGNEADLILILTFEPQDSMRKDLQVARTTFTRYRDSFGLGVGSGRDSIASHYALESPAAVFVSGGDSLWVHDTGEGLTFELDANGICRGLAVHTTNRKPTVHYRADYPEMATIDPAEPAIE